MIFLILECHFWRLITDLSFVFEKTAYDYHPSTKEWNRLMHSLNGNILNIVFKAYVFYILAYASYLSAESNHIDIVTSSISGFDFSNAAVVQIPFPYFKLRGDVVYNDSHWFIVALSLDVPAYPTFRFIPPMMCIDQDTYRVSKFKTHCDHGLIEGALFSLDHFDFISNASHLAVVLSNNIAMTFLLHPFLSWIVENLSSTRYVYGCVQDLKPWE